VPTPSANHTPSATNQVLRESIVLADTGAQQLRSYTGRLLSRGGASAVASARLARRATRDDRARARRSQFVHVEHSSCERQLSLCGLKACLGLTVLPLRL